MLFDLLNFPKFRFVDIVAFSNSKTLSIGMIRLDLLKALFLFPLIKLLVLHIEKRRKIAVSWIKVRCSNISKLQSWVVISSSVFNEQTPFEITIAFCLWHELLVCQLNGFGSPPNMLRVPFIGSHKRDNWKKYVQELTFPLFCKMSD